MLDKRQRFTEEYVKAEIDYIGENLQKIFQETTDEKIKSYARDEILKKRKEFARLSELYDREFAELMKEVNKKEK